MKYPFLLIVVVAVLCVGSRAKEPEPACSEYFGIVEYDPGIPSLFIAKMSDSQAKWFAKKGPKEFPGLCLSLEKARYLVVWSVATETWKAQETVHRNAQIDTSTRGQQSGTFEASDTYGALARGDYDGTFSSNSNSTISYEDTVPVTRAADHCSIYVVKATGKTIGDDIRSRSVQPQVIYSHETFRPRVTGEGDQSAAAIGHIFRREPTVSALDDSLKFIFQHGAEAQTLAVFATAPRQYTTNGSPQIGSSQTVPDTDQKGAGHDSMQAPLAAADSKVSSVSFSSDPSGADVYVDDNFMGNTPSQIHLPDGAHVVRIELKGHKAWSRTINLTAGGTVSLKATLDAEEPR